MSATEPVRISERVKGIIEDRKEEEGHTNMDSAVRSIFRDAGYDC